MNDFVVVSEETEADEETKGTSWLRPGQSEVCIMAIKFQASHLTSLNLGFLKINNIYSDKNKN